VLASDEWGGQGWTERRWEWLASLHVKSSEREKSRMYLKRTRVAMQALIALSARRQSVVLDPTEDGVACARAAFEMSREKGERKRTLTTTPTPSSPQQQPSSSHQSPTSAKQKPAQQPV
jgi:hypothetical protein